MKVRDFRGNVPQARTRSLSERYQALDELDDSKIAKRKFRYWREIHLVRDRIFHARDNHDLNHRSRPRSSRQDNKSPGCTWRWDAVAGICSRRNFDFGDDARERAQALSPFCESNEHDPQISSLFAAVFRGSRNCDRAPSAPHLNPLPDRRERRFIVSASSIGTYATLLRGSFRRGEKELKAREQRLKSSNERRCEEWYASTR